MPTEKKAEPTPRPWRYIDRDGDGTSILIRSATSLTVCLITWAGNDSFDEDFANAALICRAVNAFDDLVAACEQALKTYEVIDDDNYSPMTRQMLRAALDKAREGTEA